MSDNFISNLFSTFTGQKKDDNDTSEIDNKRNALASYTSVGYNILFFIICLFI